jgi:hypothetical protein
MGRLPELHPAPEVGGEASILRPHPDDLCENSARPDGCFVTGLATQPLEIMGSLPKLQPAAEDRGNFGEIGAEGPSRRAASGGAPQDEESCESCFVTDLAGQTPEIMGRLPELQPTPDDGPAPSARCPRESGDPEAAAATLQTERPDLGVRVRGHGADSPVPGDAGAAEEEAAEAPSSANAAPGKTHFVTGFASQTLEIMGGLPERNRRRATASVLRDAPLGAALLRMKSRATTAPGRAAAL